MSIHLSKAIMSNHRASGLGVLGLMSLMAGGWAIPGAAQAEGRGQFTAGIVSFGARSPLAGASHTGEAGVIPWLSYKSERFSVDPTGISVQLYRAGGIEVQGLLAPRWLLVDPDDSTLHDDLRRRTGFDVGARMNASVGPTTVSVTYRGDVSGRIDGHELTAEAGFGMQLPGNAMLGLRGGTYWRNSKLNTYLYGVFADEVRADRSEHRVSAGLTPFAGLVVNYPVAGKLNATLAVEAQYLSDSAADSPIISRRVVPSGMVGLFYSF
jgi:outer membrane protein